MNRMAVQAGVRQRNVSSKARHILLAGIAVLSLSLAGCQEETTRYSSNRGQIPLSAAVISEFEAKGMTKASPVLMRIFKQESELEVWKMTSGGTYELFKTYPICKWSGDLGPKVREGDRQAPEGFYNITPSLMNPNSSYFLAFNMGFPNQFDRAHGRTGSHLMVHGDCSSRGCYAMTDPNIAEIYAIAREALAAGQPSFQVQAYPFRMTPKNLARHRNNPNMTFWKTLKEGHDHFVVTKAEPKVDVCEKRYVFNAVSPQIAANISLPAGVPVEMAQRNDANAWGNIGRAGSSTTARVTTQAAPALATPTLTQPAMSTAPSSREKRMAVPATKDLSFSATDRCPTFVVPPAIASAVSAKNNRDMAEVASLIQSGTDAAPIRSGRDGGQHPQFAFDPKLPAALRMEEAAQPPVAAAAEPVAASTMMASAPIPLASPRRPVTAIAQQQPIPAEQPAAGGGLFSRLIGSGEPAAPAAQSSIAQSSVARWRDKRAASHHGCRHCPSV